MQWRNRVTVCAPTIFLLLLYCLSLVRAEDAAPTEIPASAQTPVPAEDITTLDKPEVQAALYKDLQNLENDIIEIVNDATSVIADLDLSRGQKKSVNHWSHSLLASTKSVITTEAPGPALADVWANAERAVKALEEPGNQELFGLAYPTIYGATVKVRDTAKHLASSYLGDDQTKTLGGHIEDYAKETAGSVSQSMLGRVFLRNPLSRNLFSAGDVGRKVVTKVVKAPLAPGKAIGHGSQQLDELNANLKRIGDIATEFKDGTSGEPGTTLDRFDQSHAAVSKSIQEVNQGLDTLHASIRDADQLTSGVQEAIASIQGASEDLSKTADAFTQTAKTTGETSEEIQKLVESIEHLVETSRAPRDPPDPPSSDNPQTHKFDVREYRDAADSINSAAIEVRGLLTDIDTMVAPSKDEAPSGDDSDAGNAIDGIADRLEGLIDHAALRVAQLLVLTSALGAALIFFARLRSSKVE